MSRRLAAASMLSVLASALGAAGDPDVRTLLSHRMPVEIDGVAAVTRLELPPAVLAECRSDLADLRLMTADGTPVPFLLDSARTPTPSEDERVLVTYPLHLLDVRREEIRRETGPAEWHERYDVEREPIGGSAPGDWALVIESRVPTFVRHVRVEALEVDRTTSPLVPSAPIYRLTHPHRQRIRVPLPRAAWRLRVDISGEGARYLDPTMRIEVSRPAAEIARAAIPLAALATEDRGDRTVSEFALPGALIPDRLLVDTTTPAFSRLVSVALRGLRTGDMPVIGHDVIARAAPGMPIDPNEVVLRANGGGRLPSGVERLVVTIEDGDSPPLADLVLTALVPIPILIFATPAQAVHLYFGGRRLKRPRYDVARLAELWQSLDAADVAAGSLGPLEKNTSFDPRPLLEQALTPATTIDRRPFSHRRSLEVPESPDGLSHLRLEPLDLAIARRDLADVRVVDASDQQWPYLVTTAVDPTWQPVTLTHLESDDGWSRYRVALPATPTLASDLEIVFDPPLVARDAELEVPGDRDTEVVARGPIGSARTTFTLGDRWIDALVLRVRDGDERPLALEQARLRLPGRTLDIVAPAGQYTLLLGYPDALAPEYALRKIRPMLAEADGRRATAGPLEANPVFAQGARLGGWLGASGPSVAVWVVVVLAAIVLLGVTLWVVRQPPEESSDGPASDDSSEEPTL